MIELTKGDKNYKIAYFQHMLHHKNLESVFENGLLSHNEAYKKGLVKEDISMDDVQKRRQAKNIKIRDKTLGVHDFVSLYFNAKNPMLYKRRNIQNDLVILLVDTEVLGQEYTLFSDGNAASSRTKFFSTKKNRLEHLHLNLIFGNSWYHENPEILKENRRKKCAEILAYPKVSTSHIRKIICSSQSIHDFVQAITSKPEHIDVLIDTNYFFL